ncbi:MAG: RdgB/HAM1 family non-canonical purine NTP pyrophosphatase [Candidatus Eremiobacteraeota bacterium]|nr:RdgB/HAM1 family non-canonical purine NTP pyrophosphatase [Candidatus Eremiobacteraeota bacterium]
MHSFVVATGNPHKIEEIRAILKDYPVELKSLADFDPTPEPVENGTTYLENALIKARAYARHTGAACLADDSGLEVDAMGGQPGLHSARFAGADTPHSQKILKVLERLSDLPTEQRSARFRCVAALVYPDGREESVEGVCEGRIAQKPSGDGGFGYDPIFELPHRGCTMAEIEAEEKNTISHRARAFLGLMEALDIAPQSVSNSY